MGAARKSIDAQDKYDSLVLETIKSIDIKVDKIDDKADKLSDALVANTNETKKINTRLRKVEETVFSTKLVESTFILRDPKVQKVLLYIVAGGVTIYLAARGISIPLP